MQWKVIEDFPNYSVSECGDIENTSTGKILKKGYISKGYIGYKLYVGDGRFKSVKAHRIVALAFIPNPNGYPQVNHINGIKDDNRVENLEWCTNAMNQRHAKKMGLNPSGEKCGTSKLTEADVRVIRKIENPNITRIAREYGVSRRAIRAVIRNESWRLYETEQRQIQGT